jgi:chemotaxis protein MotA|tara:strand:- start:161 stop:928 length:768 start_codon:yes stop_codon:yes gene_type:complete
MDLASLIGFIGTLGMIAGAMVSAGGLGMFVDVPSLLIVVGGSFFAVMYTAPLPVFLGSFGAMGKAFKPPIKKMDELITRIVELAGIARKDGMMALEGQETPDPFFDNGLQMLVDGADEEKLTVQLKKELKAMQGRHTQATGVAQAWVDISPAMGMIGTLVGLVAMLGNMADPKAIGPAMAVALLTTLYGAMIANTIFMPIVVKMKGYSTYETTYRESIIIGLQLISRGESGRNIQDQLVANLPPKEKQALLEAAA